MIKQKQLFFMTAVVLLLVILSAVGCKTKTKQNAVTSSVAISKNTELRSNSVYEKVKKNKVLRAGIRYDFPPVSYINNGGEWVGFDVDMAEEIAKKLGVKLEKVKVDETTRITFLQDGRIDVAVASMNHTQKREEAVDFSQTYFWGNQTFLVQKGKYTGLKQLFGKTVAMNKGSSAIDGWKKWTEENGGQTGKIVEFANKQEALQALKNGAVEGYGEDNIPLATLASNDPNLTVLKDGFNPVQYGIGILENDSDWKDNINYVLQAMWKDGTFEKIYNKSFGESSAVPIEMGGKIELWP